MNMNRGLKDALVALPCPDLQTVCVALKFSPAPTKSRPTRGLGELGSLVSQFSGCGTHAVCDVAPSQPFRQTQRLPNLGPPNVGAFGSAALC